ncbi:NADH:flavin oxidoreductase/NADH oxidase [Luteibacter aegosomatis]|uniref:NADH:flavin oxidoreductase/NADH oxidase n=1 Tax=Luteibacter aegosomatis TaxID=2911537 RepID=UPI000E2A481F|nr:NADH:flavin oxidoreductase/NADH oxidase [Luteibacter aegosomatis]UPG87262.1 NADH:flavin oxidoreductase/NADH oxidase [Luteibacter aegosomatis]SVK37476.1 Putative FMN oxidoreductase [Acinetobacter baumannii]
MKLFEPVALRDVTLRNRLVVSPMCQYSAQGGYVNDHHLINLGRFAMGGFGLIMVEATAIVPEGRITHGDLGLWSDDHIPGLRRIAEALKMYGAVAGIQIAHAGPKAASQRPWQGNGALDDSDFQRGEQPWPVVSASNKPYADGWLKPTALTSATMAEVKQAFVDAARRADAAGFDVIEVHCAHGYLLNSFLSPVTNDRKDEYGGDLEGRMRFPLEVVQAVRAIWPQDKPLFVRVSAVDGLREGMSIEDTIVFAHRLKALSVDIVDCSSGGIAPRYEYPSSYGYQVPYAQKVRSEVGIGTAAVGLIVNGRQAEAIVESGQADLVAIGREALADPNFALHAEAELGTVDPKAPFASWPTQVAWWLQGRSVQIQTFSGRS